MVLAMEGDDELRKFMYSANVQIPSGGVPELIQPELLKKKGKKA